MHHNGPCDKTFSPKFHHNKETRQKKRFAEIFKFYLKCIKGLKGSSSVYCKCKRMSLAAILSPVGMLFTIP